MSDMATSLPGIGIKQIAALRALRDGPRTRRGIVLAMRADSVAPATANKIIDNLLERGFVEPIFGTIALTATGRRALPSDQVLRPMRPYVPPKVVRRPGSDRASKLPSRYGDDLVYGRRF